MERRQSLEREGEQLRLAFLINFAVCDGKRLTGEWERYAERLAESPDAAVDNAAIIAAARELLQGQ